MPSLMLTAIKCAKFKFFRRCCTRAASSAAVVLLLLLGYVFINTATVQAGQCAVPSEAGGWRNSDATMRGITQLDFRMECRDASTTTCDGDTCTTTSAVVPHYFVTMFGSCSPSDCPWGEVEGQALMGNLAGWYYFYYDQGFAKRHVYIRTYPEWPGWLRLWVSTDFIDPARADYTSDNWFLHR